MKKLYKIIAVLLSAVLITAATGCKEDKGESGSESVISDTDIVLAENNNTRYKILIPSEPESDEKLASEELQNFFKESTGAEISVINDNGLQFSDKQYIISLGETVFAQGSGVEAEYNDLGSSGFKIKVIGNAVIIIGGTAEGTLFGTYDFLEKNFNIKFYTSDEVNVPKSDKLFLKKFDYTEIPSFGTRIQNSADLDSADQLTRHRLRLNTNNSEIWGGLWAHTTLQLLSPDKYGAEHPDWFSADKGEVCFCNEGAIDQIVENLKAYVLAADEKTEFFMIGAADNSSYCNCADCKASYDKYTLSGTYIRFVNEIARKMKTWQLSVGITKNYMYGAFGYRKTETPPIVYNANTDSYSLIDDSVKAEDNVAIMIALLYRSFNHDLYDTENNSAAKEAIEGWSTVSKNMFVWTYSINFGQTNVWFNNFSTIKSDYLKYKAVNAKYMFDEMLYEGVTSGFSLVKAYVESKLMWNVNQDPYELAYDFIDNYYKDGAPYIKELFDLVNYRYMQIDEELTLSGGGGLQTRWHTMQEPNLVSSGYWPKPFLDKCLSLIDSALAAADKIANETVKEKVKLRIKLEGIAVKYLLLEIHSAYYTYSSYNKLIDSFEEDCADCNVVTYAEGGISKYPISDKIQSYRNKNNF